MGTTGAYDFKLADARAQDDENLIRHGEWSWVHREGLGLMVWARCPDCGNLSTLHRKGARPGFYHDLDARGHLEPSVQCSHPACGFHTQPTRLLDFTDRR
jgi:hypothetical protein